jgi:hypothetical protein
MVTQVQSAREVATSERDTEDFLDLLHIASEAVASTTPFYVSSILGRPWTWIPPYARYSEFRILDLWRLTRTLKYLANITLPSISVTPPPFGPPLLNELLFHPTVLLQRPDQYGSYTSFPKEAWFFINGILTDDNIAQVNAAYLSYLFHRPLTLIQNSTDGLVLDLLECALGKEWSQNTESVVKAFPALYDALKSEKEKVVVICHSQGTIIMARVLNLLNQMTRPEPKPAAGQVFALEAFAPPEFVYPEQEGLNMKDFDLLTENELAKLEVYCFANCANTMRYYREPQDGARPIPWIESFGNENDLVARLGMLAPHPAQWGIRIDGPRYERFEAWGHLLNQHYLSGIDEFQKEGHKRGGKGGSEPFQLINAKSYPEAGTPRLFSYINGGSPKGA